MKRRIFLVSYVLVTGLTLTLQSCQDDPIIPNTSSTNGVDTTWVSDSTSNNDNNNDDNNNGDSTDSTIIDNGGIDSTIIDNGGGDDSVDSTIWNDGTLDSGDSTNFGG